LSTGDSMSLHLPHVTKSVVVDVVTGKRVLRTITSIDGVSLKEDSELIPESDEWLKGIVQASIRQDATINKLLNST
jgi:hypothetical protein